jgi:thiamine biosynthesis lipoprotein
MSPAESARSFRAMGSDCIIRIVVDDGDGSDVAVMLDRAETRVSELEKRWSRFLADSELSQLNAHAGAPVFVSPETFELVSLAIESWRATEGLFDPTMLDALRDAGYDATFDELAERTSFVPASSAVSASGSRGLAGVELDARTSMVLAPSGLHLDLGGIGKGHAADVVFAMVMSAGASGACLDLGGDVRVGGIAADGGGWAVAIDDPFHPGEDLAVVGLAEGSVTTSSRLRRRWETDDGEAHHLIDPSTGRPARAGLAAVSVIAASAAWGEVHAKAALIAGPRDGVALLENAGLCGLLVADDGSVTHAGPFGRFLVAGPTVET